MGVQLAIALLQPHIDAGRAAAKWRSPLFKTLMYSSALCIYTLLIQFVKNIHKQEMLLSFPLNSDQVDSFISQPFHLIRPPCPLVSCNTVKTTQGKPCATNKRSQPSKRKPTIEEKGGMVHWSRTCEQQHARSLLQSWRSTRFYIAATKHTQITARAIFPSVV